MAAEAAVVVVAAAAVHVYARARACTRASEPAPPAAMLPVGSISSVRHNRVSCGCRGCYLPKKHMFIPSAPGGKGHADVDVGLFS